MLSKQKLTLSLASFVMFIAFGLVIYAPSVMADGATHDFGVAISPAENMIDVSSDGGMQIASGRDRASRALASDTIISLLITTNEIVHLAGPGATLTERDGPLDVTDLIIDAYGPKGRALGIITLAEFTDMGVLITTDRVVDLSHRDPLNPGKEFLAEIDANALQDAYIGRAGATASIEIHTLLISIPKAALNQADIAHVTAIRNDAHAVHTSAAVAVYRVDLVDDDEGNPQYNRGVTTTPVVAVDASGGTPGVVAIQTLRERAGFIETGPFDVRIILTEEPTGGLTTDLISVTTAAGASGGSATNVTKGQTLNGAHDEIEASGQGQIPVVLGRAAQESELTADVVSYTPMAGPPDTENGVPVVLPEATGRDNEYHQYFVTIAPTPGHVGPIRVSVNQFDDKVIPLPNTYVPLSPQQVVATMLDVVATADAPRPRAIVRDARVANETLTVEVAAVADTLVAAATKAYDARQKDVYDVAVNEMVLAEKLVIPAGGYLVLTADRGKAAIADPAERSKRR